MNRELPRTLLVGAGNVAQQLACALARSTELVAWANRTPSHVPEIGVPVAGLSEVASYQADIVVISVADNAIDSIVEAVGTLENNPLCLLTSGSVSMRKLLPLSNRVGVLYPLQTFSKGYEVDLAEVPFFTEAVDTRDLDEIDALVRRFGATPYHADEEQRATLHIAGVLTNNFVNVLLEQAQKVLKSKGYPLEVVKPLAEMTLRKAFDVGPHDAQTGPARRGDADIMRGQTARVSDELRPAFEELNKLICKSHNTQYFK